MCGISVTRKTRFRKNKKIKKKMKKKKMKNVNAAFFESTIKYNAYMVMKINSTLTSVYIRCWNTRLQVYYFFFFLISNKCI